MPPQKAERFERKQIEKFVEQEFKEQKEYSEVQVERLKWRIEKMEEKMVKQQPRIYIDIR